MRTFIILLSLRGASRETRVTVYRVEATRAKTEAEKLVTAPPGRYGIASHKFQLAMTNGGIRFAMTNGGVWSSSRYSFPG